MRDDLKAIRDNWTAMPFPPVFGEGSDYARKLQARPFDYFLKRFQRLTPGGGVALDAGCGSAAWSYPLAELYDRVIAVDWTRARIDAGRWVGKKYGCERVEVSCGDITNLECANESVDFVFCYGVIVSILPLRLMMREFHRVLKPGGVAYVCLNARGWSEYLRDERGKASSSYATIGRRGLFNTICRVRYGEVADLFSRLLVDYAAREEVSAALASRLKIGASEAKALISDLVTRQEIGSIGYISGRRYSTGILAKLVGAVTGQPSREESEAFTALVDEVFDAAGYPNPEFRATLDEIRSACGDDYASTFALDLLNLVSGRTTAFSHANAGRCYEPGEVARIVEENEFENFKWAGEGHLVGPGGTDVAVDPIMQSEFNGKLCVWEFTVNKSLRGATDTRRTEEQTSKPTAAVQTPPAAAPVRPALEASAPVAAGLVARAKAASDGLLTRVLAPFRGDAIRPGPASGAPRRAAPIAAPVDLSSREPVLLKYPAPYRAMLSINNDIDGTGQDTFLDWHSHVNGTGETRYGEGLGLEVSDSFWIWSSDRLSLYHNVPHLGRKSKSPDYDLIVELAREGWLDTMHSFGSWQEQIMLLRPEIEAALEEMDKAGIRPRCFVNHGGGKHMSCNVGGIWGYYQHADDPAHESYCLDLILRNGFRYFWTDVFFESQKFGENAQYDAKEIKRDLARYNDRRFLRLREKSTDEGERIAVRALGATSAVTAKELLFNSTLIPNRMRDGTNVLCFKRYRGHYPPDSGSFALQATTENLDWLVAHEANVAVYQHFGIWRALGSPHKDYRSWRWARKPVLNDHCLAAWSELKERQDRGEILITTTGRLLDYLRMRENIVYRVEPLGNGYRIVLDAIECPAYGRTADLTAADVQGLSFSVKGAGTHVEIALAHSGERLASERRVVEAENRVVVMVPWRRLKWSLPAPKSASERTAA
jgi:SAM-dependent methyltransferase